MSEQNLQSDSTGNHLLGALPAEYRKKLLKKAESIELKFGDVVFEPDDIISNVYFPESGIISILSTIDKKSMLEVGIVGREGMAGLPAFLEVKRSGNHAVVQGSGTASMIDSAVFAAECRQDENLNYLLRRYTHSFLTQVSQSAACNRFHKVQARLARWLLMTHDRMQVDEFDLTQEFLSHMLGVRREAVTLAAQELQRNELISYSRGKLKVLNRAGLEGTTCACYAAIVKEEQCILPSINNQ